MIEVVHWIFSPFLVIFLGFSVLVTDFIGEGDRLAGKESGDRPSSTQRQDPRLPESLPQRR
jgi:hypothetical protein